MLSSTSQRTTTDSVSSAALKNQQDIDMELPNLVPSLLGSERVFMFMFWPWTHEPVQLAFQAVPSFVIFRGGSPHMSCNDSSSLECIDLSHGDTMFPLEMKRLELQKINAANTLCFPYNKEEGRFHEKNPP